MAMKQCPVCGEKYSDTYKHCPFCEEEEALRDGTQIRRTAGRGGKRAAARGGGEPNLLSPILVVLIVIMAALLVYLLFGDKIAERLSPAEDDQTPPVEEVTPDEPTIPDEPEEQDDPAGGVTMPEEEGVAGGGEETEADEPSALPHTLTVTYMSSPREEFTMSVGDDPIPLGASGGSGTYTWSSSDEAVATVDAGGRVTAVAAGQATLTVTDGTRQGTCLVRVRGGSGGLGAGSATVVNAASGVRVRSEPNTSSEVLATLANGSSVRVLQSAGTNWYQISFTASGGQTVTGYMMGEYLSNT